MRAAKLILLVSVVFLLSAAYAADPEKTPVVKISQENAKVLAINYAKTELKASANVTVVEIELETSTRLYLVKLKDNGNEYSLNVDSISGAVSVYSETVGARPTETTKAEQGKVEKTEEKKKEEIKGKEEKEKMMQFAQTGNNFSGKYVSFRYSNGYILNYSLGGKTIFTSISTGFTPVSIKAEGSEVKFKDKEDGGKIELEIHDNPDGLMMIETEDKIMVNFTLAAGIGGNVNQGEVELTGANASIVSVGREGTVVFTLTGNVLGASLDHAKIMFKSMPLTSKTEKEKELDDKVREGIADGKIGAVVNIENIDSHDEVSLDVTTTVKTVKNNSVSINVSSNLTGGKTIVIRVSNDILAAANPRDIRVQFDGAEIQQADNYTDVIDLKGDKPRYLIVIGASDVEALVSIPKFSEHEITLTTAAVKTPGFTAVLVALALVLAVLYHVRRK